jgi:hypothetical protein
MRLIVAIFAMLVAVTAYASDEPIRNRNQQIIGYLRPQVGQSRTVVLDACRLSLGYTSNNGTFTMTNIRLADSPIPFLLLQGPNACDLTKANLS